MQKENGKCCDQNSKVVIIKMFLAKSTQLLLCLPD
jgi:hypothetical protein